ncbi:MAG TPA: YbaB/EbfC family nucleoid-associated protein [Solirubrobacteraceae bacterium]
MPQPKMPGMQQMLRQAQKMQQEMQAAQEQLRNEVLEASAGGGMVKVRVSGDLQVKAVEIDPGALDPEDVEILCEMVLAATNEALRSAQQLAEERMGRLTGGLDLGALGMPGL